MGGFSQTQGGLCMGGFCQCQTHGGLSMEVSVSTKHKEVYVW